MQIWYYVELKFKNGHYIITKGSYIYEASYVYERFLPSISLFPLRICKCRYKGSNLSMNL